MVAHRQRPRGRRLSVRDLGAYELAFYAVDAPRLAAVSGVLAHALRGSRFGVEEWLERSRALAERYQLDVSQVMAGDEERAAERCRELAAHREELLHLHGALENGLEGAIWRASLAGEEAIARALDQLDHDLVVSLQRAREEARLGAKRGRLPMALLREISLDDGEL